MMYLSPNIYILFPLYAYVQVWKMVVTLQLGQELTDDEIGIKEHRDDDNTGHGGYRELGGGVRNSSSDGDGHCGGINGLRSFWAKVSLAVRPGSRYSAPGMSWNYATLYFWTLGARVKRKIGMLRLFLDQATARWHFFFESWTLGVWGGAWVDVELYRLYGL